MANYCFNELKVVGDEKQMKEFVKKTGLKENKFDFEKLYPTPKELLKHNSPVCDETLKKKFKKEYKAEDWYDWRLKNWGTKWGAYKDSINAEVDEYSVEVSFDSPWAPPIGWLKKVSKDFKKLKFVLKYDEPGVGFLGFAIIEKGKVEDNCKSY